VVKADSQQLKYKVGDGQVQTEEFLEGLRNVTARFVISKLMTYFRLLRAAETMKGATIKMM